MRSPKLGFPVLGLDYPKERIVDLSKVAFARPDTTREASRPAAADVLASPQTMPSDHLHASLRMSRPLALRDDLLSYLSCTAPDRGPHHRRAAVRKPASVTCWPTSKPTTTCGRGSRSSCNGADAATLT